MSNDRARDAHPQRDVLPEASPSRQPGTVQRRAPATAPVDLGTAGHVQPTRGAFDEGQLAALGALDLSAPAQPSTVVQRRVVQRDVRGALQDRRRRHEVVVSRDYPAFRSAVEAWLARQVMSRTDSIHRERPLVEASNLQELHTRLIEHNFAGQTVVLEAHLIAGANRYERVEFETPGVTILPMINIEGEVPDLPCEPDQQAVLPEQVGPEVSVDATTGVNLGVAAAGAGMALVQPELALVALGALAAAMQGLMDQARIQSCAQRDKPIIERHLADQQAEIQSLRQQHPDATIYARVRMNAYVHEANPQEPGDSSFVANATVTGVSVTTQHQEPATRIGAHRQWIYSYWRRTDIFVFTVPISFQPSPGANRNTDSPRGDGGRGDERCRD